MGCLAGVGAHLHPAPRALVTRARGLVALALLVILAGKVALLYGFLKLLLVGIYLADLIPAVILHGGRPALEAA